MGFYIPNDIPLEQRNVQKIEKPRNFDEVPEDKVLICQVDNIMFKANGLCYDEREFRDFTQPSDDRPKKWFLMDKELGYNLSKFNRDLIVKKTFLKKN